MILRADHVAGAAFVVFGIAVIALSGDLPTGQLSMPGSGFMPKIVAVLTIFFGLVPFLLPLPLMALGLFASFVQMFIFVMLTTIYIAGAEAEAH